MKKFGDLVKKFTKKGKGISFKFSGKSVLAFLKDSRKVTQIVFVIVVVLLIVSMYLGGSFEAPRSRRVIHYTETPWPTYSIPSTNAVTETVPAP